MGLTPEKALVLQLEDPAGATAVAGGIRDPWQPEDILQDFQEFWKYLDDLNETLPP